MAMTMDHQQRQLGGLTFDHLPYAHQPQFTNPWANPTPTNTSASLFPGLNGLPRQQTQSSVSMPYSSIPVSAPSLGTDLLNSGRSYGSDNSYSSTHSPVTNTYAPTSAPYANMDYTQNRSPYTMQQQQQQPQQQSNERRLSHPSLSTNTFLGSPVEGQQRQRQNSLIDFNRSLANVQQQQRENFGDALDASRGMLAMSQDATPRNIYAPRSGRGSGDSYGFPATHSSSSSISSASTYPSYYGSVDGSSVTDYSSASESLEPMSSRTLPPPSGLMAANVPNPQSMMGQFSSKVSSSTQKKHKCKICDKRFTRPSSLQTHMYSHTGEKPYSCDVDGCGRHFSVVSNLRRHRKVHKGERDHDLDD
ncbi:MAG: hypothetical protein M1827_004295 [Pycnora praestabilis]|nr:MAG: hypothetical protein M1827_004295 [Pycnora praestabilis]